MKNKKKINRIMVPTDFSRGVSHALAIAAELCRKSDARLYITHVIEKEVDKQPGTPTMLDSFRNVHNMGNLRTVLDHWSDMLKVKYKIESRTDLLDGIPFEEICKFAAKEDIDLIVMGADGQSGSRDFSIGSTAYNVIKNAGISVLTIPRNFLSEEFKNILFPVRPVNGIWEKFEALKPLLAEKDNYLHIAEFCSDLENGVAGDNDEIEKIIDFSRQTDLTCIQEKYSSSNTAEKVLELSNKLKADLIAINATMIRRKNSYYVDPYTRQVINHASVPVFSFRH